MVVRVVCWALMELGLGLGMYMVVVITSLTGEEEFVRKARPSRACRLNIYSLKTLETINHDDKGAGRMG